MRYTQIQMSINSIIGSIVLFGIFTSYGCKSDKKNIDEIVMGFEIEGQTDVQDAELMVAGTPEFSDLDWVYQLEGENSYNFSDKNHEVGGVTERKWYLVDRVENEELIGVGSAFEFSPSDTGLFKVKLCYNDNLKCTSRWLYVSGVDRPIVKEDDTQMEGALSNNKQTDDLILDEAKVERKMSINTQLEKSDKDFVVGKNQIVEIDRSKSTETTQGKSEKNSLTISTQKAAEIKEVPNFIEPKVEKEMISEEIKPSEKDIKVKPKSFELKDEGRILQLTTEDCIRQNGKTKNTGSMKLSASKLTRLKGGSVWATQQGQIKINLTGPNGESGELKKFLNAGANVIRFSEWPHLLLKSGESWLLEFQSIDGVKLFEVNSCVSGTGTELRPMNSFFIYNLTYYN
ncbi:MAG: hypothetical protein IPO72_10330 [Saprospiraceae bacterium]|nr:hypothetical protein [Candidatus Vicinibacter affinis]HQX43524.1 hypothetical protein [Saprospiraceae bacterium]MBK7302456.1 hypothetical protein [Candidatus Vicinibacter affinis]MBK7695788.1 hypothetical protein [Candidatus Vicinibacter affinis]MBK8643158.1 hypothetical protein [Candidatus Vicinibacter affinis]